MPRKKKVDLVPLVPDTRIPLHKDQHGRWVTELGAPAPLKNDRLEPNYVWNDVYSESIRPVDIPAAEKEVREFLPAHPFVQADDPARYAPLAVTPKRYGASIVNSGTILSQGQFGPGTYTASPQTEPTVDHEPSTSNNLNFRGTAARYWDRG
ncbi:hypothetical protein [Frankia sp. CcI49]|uniref:hypothetical protein n=1 Tax=Frankia sp. CcI49 TaxID=1745382 RepID=UPI0010545DD7|nr:hypothetical protein [Frankia sp. CcI49]